MRQKFLLCAVAALTAACRRAPPGSVEATGTLEYVTIDVGATVPARVVRVLVSEGDWVRAGDTLAVLMQPTLGADARQRAARARAAAATVEELANGPRAEELQRARAERDAVDSDAARLAREAERLRPLAASGVISQQQLDAAQTAARSAGARLEASRAQLQLLERGTRAERLRAARADAEGATAWEQMVAATAADLVLRAPIDGMVVTRAIEPGEVVTAGQAALVVADTRRVWVRVFVSEAVLPRLQVGQKVHGVLDAYPERDFSGSVSSIRPNAEFTPRVALTERERADLLFGVKVEFADTTRVLKAGLPITVHIEAPVPAKAP